MTAVEDTPGPGLPDLPEAASPADPVVRPPPATRRWRLPVSRLTLAGIVLSVLVVLGDALVLDGRLLGSRAWAFVVWGVVAMALAVGAVAYLKRKRDES